jgi:hypothetical protein
VLTGVKKMKLSPKTKEHLKQLINEIEPNVLYFKDKPEWKEQYEMALELIAFLKTGLED